MALYVSLLFVDKMNALTITKRTLNNDSEGVNFFIIL
jgi:hypothetical protein